MTAAGGSAAGGSPAADDAPVVVTLVLDDASQAWFDALRRELFPPERNHLAAHLTLFHALPGDVLRRAVDDVVAVTRRAPLELVVTRLRPLGRGVAYELDSPALLEVHAALRARWLPELTAQDRAPLRPHVTVQNKVAPEVARRTLARLAAEPLLPAAVGVGIAVWRYRGGPWEHVRTAAFRSSGGTAVRAAELAPVDPRQAGQRRQRAQSINPA